MKLSHIFTGDFSHGKLFDIPPQPVNVMLDVTNFCNNRCVYCYNPGDEAWRTEKPDLVVLKKIVSLIGETGTKEILYLGGEPFSLPGIADLLETGRNLQIFQRAVSNGSYFDTVAKCADLKEHGLDEVGISFHSSKADIHDRIAGREGSFKDAITGLGHCLDAGIRTFLQYSPNSLNDPDDVLTLGKVVKKKIGDAVSFFDINRLLPFGQGKEQKRLFLEGEEWFSFLVTATGLYDQGFEVHAELTPFCWIKSKAGDNKVSKDVVQRLFSMNRGCFMWVAQLPLDTKGRIKFCPAGPSVGPSILDVEWPDFWHIWEEFNRYREFIWNRSCVDFENQVACRYFYRCLGGCKYSRGRHYGADQYCLGLNASKPFHALEN